MKLTKEEELLILEKRAKENHNAIKKIGLLKEDLYIFGDEDLVNTDKLDTNWLFSHEDCCEMTRRFANNFKKIASKGDKFDCFIDLDGKEAWFDRIYGIENMTEAWAKKHLIDIKK